MSNTRKTIRVRDILEIANKMLAGDHEDMMVLQDKTAAQGCRLGIAHLLETILHETGNYGGYSHQKGFVDYGTPDSELGASQPPVILDDSRRCYCKSSSMWKEEGL